MVLSDQQLYEFLRDAGLVDLVALEEVYTQVKSTNSPLASALLSKQLIDEAQLQKVRATLLGIPFVDLMGNRVSVDVLRVVPEPIAKKHNIVSFRRTATELYVAMSDPDDLQTVDFIRKKTGLRIVPCLASSESIANVLAQYNKSLQAEFSDLIDIDTGKIAQDEDLSKVAEDLPVVRIVDTLLKHAIMQSASDIHIEPEEKDVVVRYRIDGILHDVMLLPSMVMRGIVARIKVLSNLKLDEHRLPQDGRFKIHKKGLKIAFRVSVLPVFDGEKIVMRLLDESSKGLTLEKVGFTGRDLEIMHRHVRKPHGMILVTGPTGSGKTTTLYTVLDQLNVPAVNISTVEDPIEYRMDRINQTQVNSKIGMTFAAALRALLRQDPDIIMVGEIRDKETLEIAMHAAMTGHLVLSTLHTNSAAGAIGRMADMGAAPFLIASTVNVIVAQRLVRKLCPHCRESYEFDDKVKESLSNMINIPEVFARLSETGRIDKGMELAQAELYCPKGCERCGNTGYKGRVGIFELLEMTPDVEQAALRSDTADAIARVARDSDGMTMMIEDGLAKALMGETSLEEVLRVTQE